MKNYIDYKETIWNRIYLADDADMDKIIADIQEKGIEDFAKEYNEFDLEQGPIYETAEYVSPDDNHGQATVEIYRNEKQVWDNEIKNFYHGS